MRALQEKLYTLPCTTLFVLFACNILQAKHSTTTVCDRPLALECLLSYKSGFNKYAEPKS